MMMLAPTVILSGRAGPLSATKMSSYAWLLFYMIHLYIYGSCLWPQVCRDLLDPFRAVFIWLQPSESQRFVFADEGYRDLMIVRE